VETARGDLQRGARGAGGGAPAAERSGGAREREQEWGGERKNGWGGAKARVRQVLATSNVLFRA
jgi:hypothetical protein